MEHLQCNYFFHFRSKHGYQIENKHLELIHQIIGSPKYIGTTMEIQEDYVYGIYILRIIGGNIVANTT